MAQLNLLSGVQTVLPDEAELHRRFAQFNIELFNAKLPEATVRWSQRMRIAGTCHRHRALITLSRLYHERFPDDIDDTLKHEMIHLRYTGHGPAFRREAKRVGASIHCREYEGIHPRAKLVYACPSCWREFRRSKPGELYCGRCSRGLLLQQFRLVLKRELETNANKHQRMPVAKKTLCRQSPNKRASRDLLATLSYGLFG